MLAPERVRLPAPDLVRPLDPEISAAMVAVTPLFVVIIASAVPKARIFPAVPVMVAPVAVNSTAPLVTVSVEPLVMETAEAAPEVTSNKLIAVVADAAVAVVIRVLSPEVKALEVNSSVWFSGRRPVVAW